MQAIRLAAAALVLLAAPAGLDAAQAQTAPAAPPASVKPAAPDPVVARVGDRVVHLSDLTAALQDLPQRLRAMPPSMLYPVLLNQAVDSEALLIMARKEKLDQNPAVQAQMRHAADEALQRALVSREIAPEVTEARIKARYEKDIAGKPGETEIHARHILVKTEAEARKIIAELKGGADFAKLAKQYSTDPGAADGGDLGFFKKGDMVPAFSQAAFALKAGEVSPTPVHTRFGWHVIQVLERRTAKPPTYAEAHDELRQKMIQEAMARLLKQAHQGLKVEKFNPDGSAPSQLDTAQPPAAKP